METDTLVIRVVELYLASGMTVSGVHQRWIVDLATEKRRHSSILSRSQLVSSVGSDFTHCLEQSEKNCSLG